ncbi:hypothetical protein CULC0102_0812 [Corynebacterium ulcerans 0102]|uniref:Uncharacterized protein n=1 Tax=Corynebacterium ulcerans TaxID=65058 RepID=A0ABD7MSZ2_CORUL|nr:hypothetical protein CULC0102_0812 [Corynebacterium ulcerans 0102]SQG51297.1 Uncharacterised protein [Corynebacterium ulcerans]SQG58117.1 Uncharacterised protein [Corynebacterium ulcerans]
MVVAGTVFQVVLLLCGDGRYREPNSGTIPAGRAVIATGDDDASGQ